MKDAAAIWNKVKKFELKELIMARGIYIYIYIIFGFGSGQRLTGSVYNRTEKPYLDPLFFIDRIPDPEITDSDSGSRPLSHKNFPYIL